MVQICIVAICVEHEEKRKRKECKIFIPNYQTHSINFVEAIKLKGTNNIQRTEDTSFESVNEKRQVFYHSNKSAVLSRGPRHLPYGFVNF